MSSTHNDHYFTKLLTKITGNQSSHFHLFYFPLSYEIKSAETEASINLDFFSFLLEKYFTASKQQNYKHSIKQYTEHQDVLVLSTENAQYQVQDFKPLNDFITHKAAELSSKILIIYSVEKLPLAFTNKLLKLLEEPPINLQIWASVGQNANLLPTLTSRATRFRLSTPFLEEIKKSDTLIKKKITKLTSIDQIKTPLEIPAALKNDHQGITRLYQEKANQLSNESCWEYQSCQNFIINLKKQDEFQKFHSPQSVQLHYLMEIIASN